MRDINILPLKTKTDHFYTMHCTVQCNNLITQVFPTYSYTTYSVIRTFTFHCLTLRSFLFYTVSSLLLKIFSHCLLLTFSYPDLYSSWPFLSLTSTLNNLSSPWLRSLWHIFPWPLLDTTISVLDLYIPWSFYILDLYLHDLFCPWPLFSLTFTSLNLSYLPLTFTYVREK